MTISFGKGITLIDSLNQLSDVNIVNPANGQVLSYLNAKWVNGAGGGGGGAAWGSITGTLSDQTDLQSALNDRLTLVGGAYDVASNIITASGGAVTFGAPIGFNSDGGDDIGSPSNRANNVYAQQFHGDGSNLTGLAYLPLTGGSMQGNIDMNQHVLSNADQITTAGTNIIGIIYNGPGGELCYLGAPNGDGYTGLYDGGDGSIATADSANNYKLCGDSMTLFNDNTWNVYSHYLANYNGDTSNNAAVVRGNFSNSFNTAAIAFVGIKTNTPNDFNRWYEITGNLVIQIAATTSSVLGGTNGVQVKYTCGLDGVVKIVRCSIPSTALTVPNSTGSALAFNSGAIFVQKNTQILLAADYTSVGVTAMQFAALFVLKEF